MSRAVKLYRKAQNNPKGLTFDELCRLAEYAGYNFERQSGTSHRIYKNPNVKDMHDQTISIQEGKYGEAKAYQVRDLISIIESHDLLEQE